MIRVIQRRLIIPRGDTGIFTIPAMTQAEGAIGVFTIFDPITNTRIFQKQVEIEGENFNISFSHADTVNLKAGDYLWDIKFYKNPILADNKVIDGEEINSYYAAFQAPKCEIRETGDDFLMIEGQPAKIEDLNIILAATEAANAAKAAAIEQADIAATKAEEAAAKLEEMKAAMPTKVSELENDSGYLQEETDPTVPAWAKAQTKPTYTAQEVGALPANTFIPSKVSDLTDDSGHYTKPANGIPASDLEETYLTQHQDISMKANSADLAAVATSGSYEDLSDKPTIPEVPVQDVQIEGTSILENGVANIPIASTNKLGAIKLGQFAQTGLQINASGQLAISPSNSPTIKGGLSAILPIVPLHQHETTFYGLAKAAGDTTQSQSDNAVGTYTDSAKTAIQNMLGVPAASAIPTLVSQLTNDSGYLTSFTETDPTVPSWAKAAQKPTYTAAEVGAPTVQEMNSAISTAIGNVNSFDMAVVQELPTQDISTHTIYLVPKTGETNDIYDEYVYINNAWEMVGNTQIDLSNYVQKTDYATYDNAGIVKIGAGLGIDGSYVTIFKASNRQIKGGTGEYAPIVAAIQDRSVFYGLATAAGDTTQSQSSNAVGTYTPEAQAAIRSMIGAAASADVTVQDVQISGTSILENGVANVPVAGTDLGVVKIDATKGIEATSVGLLQIRPASDSDIKGGANQNKPIVSSIQHRSTFYGLAKAAGDITQSQSSNAVGQYTDEAKAAIQTMLDVPAKSDIPEVPVQDVQVNGTSVLSNGVANVPYGTNNTYGAVKGHEMWGVGIQNGEIYVNEAATANIKNGTVSYKPIVPIHQHESVFYGLSKVAGVDLANQTVTLGTYPEASKTAIKEMLGVQDGLKVVRLI